MSKSAKRAKTTPFPATVPIPWEEFQTTIDALEGRYELVSVPDVKNVLQKIGMEVSAGNRKEDLVLMLVEGVAQMGVVPNEVLEEAFSVPRDEAMPAARPVNKGAAVKRASRKEAVWQHDGLFYLVLRSMLEMHYAEKRR